jgi:putative addiction module antidote
MVEVKVVQIGNSLGVILPKEVTGKLMVEKGDTVFLVASDAGYQLTTLNPEVAEQVSKARELTKRYKETLQILAK